MTLKFVIGFFKFTKEQIWKNVRAQINVVAVKLAMNINQSIFHQHLRLDVNVVAIDGLI